MYPRSAFEVARMVLEIQNTIRYLYIQVYPRSEEKRTGLLGNLALPFGRCVDRIAEPSVGRSTKGFLTMSHVAIMNDGAAEIWRIARPERGNALGLVVAAELVAALATLESSTSKPCALVLTATPAGKGAHRVWIAGGDLKELATQTTQAQGEAYASSLSAFLAGLDRLPLAVLVAVDGDAIGGGAEVALGGDIRLMTRTSRLIFRQLAVGLATGYGGARRLVELVGLSRAQDLLFSGRAVGADEALALGLVHEVLADTSTLESRIKERVATIATLEPLAVAAQKQMLWHATHSHPGVAREAETAIFRELWGNPSHRQFLAAFIARSAEKSP